MLLAGQEEMEAVLADSNAMHPNHPLERGLDYSPLQGHLLQTPGKRHESSSPA
jgi:hypothetical protein